MLKKTKAKEYAVYVRPANPPCVFLYPQVGVCPLRDNDPADPYRYEITLWTGMRRNAGTKSKVSIIVYGDEHDSEARALEDRDRSPFQRGSQDSFLLTTPFDMGTIQYIRIWHDNTGGSWFLSRIMVIDLQTDERYYFICNRWLAVDEEDGQVSECSCNSILHVYVLVRMSAAVAGFT